MRPHHATTHEYTQNIAVLDGEFDYFELNNDLSGSLHEAESATFYHDTFDVQE